MRKSDLIGLSVLILASAATSPTAAAQPANVPPPSPAVQAPLFQPAKKAVSSWRVEAAGHLVLTADQVAALLGPAAAPHVARCVKLNNYWCIKRAGWDGEIAADADGHVAFASAVEGAAVAALLLKRYYVDFNRRTALSIVARWAPAQCGGLLTGNGARTLASGRLDQTLRARWLAGHARGFVRPVAGRKAAVRRSVVAYSISRMLPTPTIAAGLDDLPKPARPMTLDALLMSSPNAPPSRSMLGMPRGGAPHPGSVSSCGADSTRIAAYAVAAAAGIVPGPGADLGLFAADGTPTPNLSILMANMARVEIGPYGATAALIQEGIERAFKAGRNPDKS